MDLQPRIGLLERLFLTCCVAATMTVSTTLGQDSAQSSAACRVEPVDYYGWSAQQISNPWIRLIVVPQNGGRLMQVTFAGHDYLFVNPELRGKYLPPTSSQWFNYGGDKLWLLPEGTQNEQQWPGNSDLIDDGPYTFKKLAEGPQCEIELVSPADPQTGIQFARTIRLDADSSRIQFRARMKNITGHSLEWSMQSVSQYNTGIPGTPGKRNPDIWGYTPTNPNSGYLNRYHVRFGPAENAAASVRDDGLFSVHYSHWAAELWIDSVAGWLAVVDGSSRFAMVEKFQYEAGKTYPGRASVIFWTNGPELRLNSDGEATFATTRESPYYMEAELNSPMCRLNPGEECRFDTDWFPTRTESEFHGVTDVGILVHPLRASRLDNGKVKLSGSFGVFYAGSLVAHFYDERGSSLNTTQVGEVTPTELANLQTEVDPKGKASRVSLHLVDRNGVDGEHFRKSQLARHKMIASTKFPAGKLLAFVFATLSCGGSTLCQQSSSAITVSPRVTVEDLEAQPIGENWTSYNGDYTGRRYSNLQAINTSNVARLQASWVFHPGNSQNLEVTPVVVRGLMFVTSSNDVFALDARTGRELWHYRRPVSSGLLDDAAAHKNRGVAVWQNFVFVETDDAHLLKLDARSGNLIWDVEYADKTKHYGATSAPLVIKDTVIVGTSGGDSGVRGFVAAYDAATGKLKWRFWTIPAPGEFGSSSWPGNSYLHGGGTTWMPGTYDPQFNTLYWTTSNAAPDFFGESRPGDDLYTACVLALDPDTGKLKWYFQFTPHDLYDYDATETPVLLDSEENGTVRHLLVQANRNGFFYVLDRSNGNFLRATPFVDKLNWATGIDAAGRPILSGRIPTAKGTHICPGIDGATNWFSPSYNPDTGLFYIMALESCNLFLSKPKEFVKGETFYNTGTTLPPGERMQKILLALSVADGKRVWSYPQTGQGNSWGGTLTTASGLVFFGDDSNSFEAVEAKTGRILWHFNTGQLMRASPMSYAVNGVQYVAIAAGSDIFCFSVPDHH